MSEKSKIVRIKGHSVSLLHSYFKSINFYYSNLDLENESVETLDDLVNAVEHFNLECHKPFKKFYTGKEASMLLAPVTETFVPFTYATERAKGLLNFVFHDFITKTILMKVKDLEANFFFGEEVVFTLDDDNMTLSLKMAPYWNAEYNRLNFSRFASKVVRSLMTDLPILNSDIRIFKQNSIQAIAKILTAHLHPNDAYPVFYDVICGDVYSCCENKISSATPEAEWKMREMLSVTVLPLMAGSFTDPLTFTWNMDELLSRPDLHPVNQ